VEIVDFILNLAGLSLWLSWRSFNLDPAVRATPSSLAGTLRRAEPRRLRAWHFLAALGLLLLLRPLLYRALGSALNWTSKLDLGVVTLAFRSDLPRTAFLYSLLSFVFTLLVFYTWLVFLAVVNKRVESPDAFLRMVRLQLGRFSRWPAPVLVILPGITIAMVWLAASPLLAWGGVVDRAQSPAHLLEQSLLVGLVIYLSLKYFIPAILLLHLISSYVYLGNHPIWEFISLTARNLLAPLRWLPLRAGKFDFAPLLGMVLSLLLLHAMPILIVQSMLEHNVILWPR
jgi:uncharacterized protein YggT (Ycf19 family)